MASSYGAPAFQFEENRLVYSLRLIAYPGDAFTSEQSVRCAFAVTAVRTNDHAPPSHETNPDEWRRVLDLLVTAEPKAWVERGWTKQPTQERLAEAESMMKKGRRGTEL
jgi:hypothetical protein